MNVFVFCKTTNNGEVGVRINIINMIMMIMAIYEHRLHGQLVKLVLAEVIRKQPGDLT